MVQGVFAVRNMDVFFADIIDINKKSRNLKVNFVVGFIYVVLSSSGLLLFFRYHNEIIPFLYRFIDRSVSLNTINITAISIAYIPLFVAYFFNERMNYDIGNISFNEVFIHISGKKTDKIYQIEALKNIEVNYTYKHYRTTLQSNPDIFRIAIPCFISFVYENTKYEYVFEVVSKQHINHFEEILIKWKKMYSDVSIN